METSARTVFGRNWSHGQPQRAQKPLLHAKNLEELGFPLLDSNSTGRIVQRRWTKEEEVRLLKLRESGKSRRQISSIVERPARYCQERAHHLRHTEGINRGRYTEDENEYIRSEVKRYTQSGKRPAWSQIAEAINRHWRLVHKHWKRDLNLAVRKGTFSVQEDARIINFMKANEDEPRRNWRQIASALGRHPERVQER